MANKVTVVIPTFNRADYVCKTIDSAINQTVECDIIVCDHGSSDNTPDVVQKYGDRIKYIRRERDFGPHFCWVEGVLNADTEYIHIHYDDDLMEPSFVEKTLALMSEDVGMVFSEASIYDLNSGNIVNPELFNIKKKNWKTGTMKSSVLEEWLLNGLMISPAACLFRKKQVVDAIIPGDLPIDFGGNYHGVGPDFLMSLLSVLRYPKFGVVCEALSLFGSHESSITMDAVADKAKWEKLQNGYDAYRRYYKLIKLYRDNEKIAQMVGAYKQRWNKKLEKKLKLFLKAIGLRKKEVK